MSYLLDTNVLSEVRTPRPAASVAHWFEQVADPALFISVLVVGEIRQSIERVRPRDPNQAQVFERWLSTLKHEFADRILPLTTTEAEAWGRLNAPAQLPIVDGLQAATALIHGFTFRDPRHETSRSDGYPATRPWRKT